MGLYLSFLFRIASRDFCSFLFFVKSQLKNFNESFRVLQSSSLILGKSDKCLFEKQSVVFSGGKLLARCVSTKKGGNYLTYIYHSIQGGQGACFPEWLAHISSLCLRRKSNDLFYLVHGNCLFGFTEEFGTPIFPWESSDFDIALQASLSLSLSSFFTLLPSFRAVLLSPFCSV